MLIVNVANTLSNAASGKKRVLGKAFEDLAFKSS